MTSPVADPVQPARAPDAPRRCFICLTDQLPSDDPSSWVDPCPCTLEAHQDCMQSWVTDCERSKRQLRCPVCKSEIRLEGAWDPIVSVYDTVLRGFSRASPYTLAASSVFGIMLSMHMYGSVSMSAFAGQETLLTFLWGPDMVLDGRKPKLGVKTSLARNLQLMSIGPMLLFGQLTPGMSNPLYVSLATSYGLFHIVHDQNFLSWPPSPQLAMAAFPCLRALYYNMWKEFAFPYEVQLNRQLQGLPPLQPQQNGQANAQNQNGQRNGEGGIQGFLQNLIDALDPEDEEHHGPQRGGQAAENIHIIHEAVDPENEDEEGEVLVELIIEEVVDEEDGNNENAAPVDDDENDIPENQHRDNARAQPLAPNPPRDEPLPQAQHEAPPAPPAGGPGLGNILTSISNAIVGALALPTLSFAVGEALRFALPKSWTSGGRPGLLQQQWGRSLVGGCLYVVLADAMRLYTKHRKVVAMANRRVKNIERRRNRK